MLSDSRVSRHAETLGLHGFKVTVVCPLSERTDRVEERTGYEIRRVRSELFHRAVTLVKRRNPSQNSLRVTQPTAQHSLPSPTGKRSLAKLKQLITNAISILLLQLALIREARRIHAHVYCANDLDTLLIAVCAAAFDGKIVYDSHELWPDMLIGTPEFWKRMWRSWEGLLVGRADSVMTVNKFIADVLKSRFGIKPPIHVIYNCPPPIVGRQRVSVHRRRKFKIVLYHGGFQAERGLENLVKAAHQLLPDIILTFRGSGSIEGELKRLATGLPNVRFEPPVRMKEVVEAASQADVGVIPYLPTNLCNYYASPNKLFEYIQAGLAIAASDLPFMRKIILENDIGTVFDPSDPSSIAEALNRVTRTQELEHYRKNQVQVMKKFSWETESQRLLRLYGSFEPRSNSSS